MKDKKTKKAAGTIRFPIGAKLVLIVTVILLVSLGAISFLVSWMVSQDLRVNAEDNNFSVNRRAAAVTETILSLFQSNARILLEGTRQNQSGQLSGTEQFTRFFFEQNRHIAALVLGGGPDGNKVLINDRFTASDFDTGGRLNYAAVAAYAASQKAAFERAALGDTLLLGASLPDTGISLLGYFFPSNGNSSGTANTGRSEAALVLFSSDSLLETFGAGINTTFLINDDGDVLVHPDPAIAETKSTSPLVTLARQSGKPFMQTTYSGANGKKYIGAFSMIPQGAVITHIEEDLVFEGIAATTRRNLYLTGAVLFLAVILIWFFSKTISGPVKLLAAAAGRIKQGEFEINVPVKSSDEIGYLTASFTEMGRGLAERERLKDVFGRFTNAAIAERAMKGELPLGGETREVTVFFSDIRSFTAISEKLNPQEVVEFLNDYMTRMVDCVDKTGGVVDKFIGDAVMAVWGAPLTAGSPAQDAMNSVKTALMMRSALYEFNKDRGDDKHPLIRIGCGINTGEVVAGQIGSNRRMEYTVIGDAVNLASRTEALNKPLGTDILITENTWNLISRYLVTEEMPPVTVKGKEKPVRLFAVINLKAPEGVEQKRPQTLAELRKILGTRSPDLARVDVNAEEQKYKISE